MWHEHSFSTLRAGMILTSMGGHRWQLLGIDGTTLHLLDLETGGEMRYTVQPHRMGWAYVVESAAP